MSKQISALETSATFTFSYNEGDREMVELFIPRDELSAAHHYLCCCLYATQFFGGKPTPDPVPISQDEFTVAVIEILVTGMVAYIFDGPDGEEAGESRLGDDKLINGCTFPIPTRIAKYLITWLKRCASSDVVADIKTIVMVDIVDKRTGRDGFGVLDKLVHVANEAIKVVDNTDLDDTDPDESEGNVTSWFDS